MKHLNVKKGLAVLGISITLLGLAACNNGGGSGGYYGGGGGYSYNTVSSFMSDLNNYYYYDGYSFSFVKYGRDNSDYIVVQYSDGYSTSYAALDIYDYLNGQSFSSYSSSNPSTFWNLDYNYDGTYTCGYYCSDWDGYAAYTSLAFEETAQSSSKDLEKARAFVEDLKQSRMSSKLQSEFGFSEERAGALAKLAGQYSMISKSRAVTEQDANAFSKELAGVDVGTLTKRLTQASSGDLAAANELITQAAEFNGVSVEQMNSFLTAVTKK